MDKRLYFAYGSNIHPVWFCQRVPSAEIVEIVKLTGWKLCFHKAGKDKSAKCNIIETDLPQATVYGVIYSINQDEKIELDRIETGYFADRIHLNRYKNVLFYRANEEYIDNQLLPYSWYKDIIISGAEYHHFPMEYISLIQSFNAVPDPDLKRENDNRSIINSK